jgi:hypothetical protein
LFEARNREANVTIYIAGPDGRPIAFESEAEIDAYRRAQREAEPPLLQCLRRHRRTIEALQQQAETAITQRRGRAAALAAIECELRGLANVMADDIQTARKQIEAVTGVEHERLRPDLYRETKTDGRKS